MLGYLHGKRFGSKIAWAIWLRFFSSQTFSRVNTPTFLKPSSFFTLTCLWRWTRQGVPKRRHIKFRRRGITQKKAYDIYHFLFLSPGSFFTPTCQWRWNRQNVPNRQHTKFRRRGITQKKAYDIQNTAKVWNQVNGRCHKREQHMSLGCAPRDFIFYFSKRWILKSN